MHRHPLNSVTLAFGYAGLIVAVASLVHLIIDLGTGSSFESLHTVELFAVVVFGFVSLLILNYTPSIEIHQDGLRVQSFGFHWIWVRWNDIIGLTESVDVGPRLRGILVRARGLTVFHRLITLWYGVGITPGFIISQGLNGYETLVEVIREKLDERIDEGYLAQ